MKTKVKIFRWNEIKNTSEVTVTFFDDSKTITRSDIERMRQRKENLKKELIK
jgi:hypothetical protein